MVIEIKGWPEKDKCPIHGLEKSRPDIGGCSCYDSKIINNAIDACQHAIEQAQEDERKLARFLCGGMQPLDLNEWEEAKHEARNILKEYIVIKREKK